MVTATTVTKDEEGVNLQRALGISLTLALIYGLLQILGLYVVQLPFALSRAFNTIGSPDALGIVAAISLPILAVGSKKTWSWYVNMAGFVGGMGILCILFWWGAWVFLVLGVVWIGLFW